MNSRYGLDASYFSNKMSRIIRDIGSYKPDEFARECARMSRTADESVMRESEFAPAVSAPGTGSDSLDCILGVGGFASFGPLEPQPAAHLTIPGSLEWDELPQPVEFDYPEYSEQGMGCGLEDRGITDRYEACRYGYQEALDQFAHIISGMGSLYTRSNAADVNRLRAELECARGDMRQADQIMERQRAEIAECQSILQAIRASGQSYAECTDRSSPTGLRIAAILEIGQMTEAELDALFTPGSGNKAKRRAESLGLTYPSAKPKTCIECDQPYCHGVCVERGDQDYDRDQAARGADQ